MVDDRYAKNRRYIESLSKWVRSDVIHHSNFNFMLAKLEPFIKEMTLQDEENRKEGNHLKRNMRINWRMQHAEC